MELKRTVDEIPRAASLQPFLDIDHSAKLSRDNKYRARIARRQWASGERGSALGHGRKGHARRGASGAGSTRRLL
jgi:hypothetical protein